MTLKTLQELEWRDTKMESDDRILQLKVMEGKKPLGVEGMVDPRLFKGTNHLHAVMNGTLWEVKMEDGTIPMPLRQQWTTFNRLLDSVKQYYATRNVEVSEIVS